MKPVRKAGCKRPARLAGASPHTHHMERAAELPLPSSLDYAPKLLPVRDQGDTSECVAFALCAMKEFQDQPGSYLDPMSIYEKRAAPQGDGMAVTDGLAIVKEQGVQPNPRLHRISSWSACGNNVELLKRALVQHGVCVASLPYVDDYKGDKFWEGDDKNGDGHCVAFVGYDDAKLSFKIRNSWGQDYAEQGYVWMSYEDFNKYCWESYSSVCKSPHADSSNCSLIS